MEKWNLIIYVPAYNVEKTISELLLRIGKNTWELEKYGAELKAVIVVNDGSTDATSKILNGLKPRFSYLSTISMETNRGPVNALFEGMENALRIARERGCPPHKTIYIRMDADLEHQPEDISKLIVPILKDETKISAGYLTFDAGTGLPAKWFNETIGLGESRRFLGVDLPQFCPGFEAVRGDLFHKMYPMLRRTSIKFEEITGKEMLTIDFIILVLAKRLGETIRAVKLTQIEKNRIKKVPIAKLFSYFDYHRKTVDFLEKNKSL